MKALHTKKRNQRGGYSLSVAISVAIKSTLRVSSEFTRGTVPSPLIVIGVSRSIALIDR